MTDPIADTISALNKIVGESIASYTTLTSRDKDEDGYFDTDTSVAISQLMQTSDFVSLQAQIVNLDIHHRAALAAERQADALERLVLVTDRQSDTLDKLFVGLGAGDFTLNLRS